MKGLIIRGVGGFYYVETETGVIEAKERGIFRKDGFVLCVGDVVDISLLPEDPGKGVIDKVFPRKNSFSRPPVANVDMFLVVFSVKTPKPNFPVIDRFLVNAEMNGIRAAICLNKADLAGKKETEDIMKIYSAAYDIFPVSAATGEGIDAVVPLLNGKKTALAGPSGVGKSSLLNVLVPEAGSRTGEVSSRTRRGKHTTRHVELFHGPGGGMIFDTPGFTSFESSEADEERLSMYYPEMAKLAGMCRYDDCRHLKEPGCAVREAVEAGEIHPVRYNNYVAYMEELKNRRKY